MTIAPSSYRQERPMSTRSADRKRALGNETSRQSKTPRAGPERSEPERIEPLQQVPQLPQHHEQEANEGPFPWDNPDLSMSEQRALKLQHFDVICSKVLDYLYVGSQTVAMDKAKLKAAGITRVVNAAGIVHPSYFPKDFAYTSYYIADHSSSDLLAMLLHFVAVVEEERLKGGRIYVHCHQGVSRSCSLAIGYVMFAHNIPYNEAYEYVKMCRGICSPNAGFMAQLMWWWQFLKEPHTTVRIVNITILVVFF